MNFLQKHKKFFIITISFLCLLSVIFSVTLRTNPSFAEKAFGFVILPLDNVLTSFSGFVEKKIYFFINVNKVENENYKLKKQIQDLEYQLSRSKLIEKDNHDLSKLIDLNQKYPDYPKTGAYVIAKSPSNWYDVFLVNKGSKENIQKNMVIISSGGLVGRIIESGESYSKVVSIIDDTSSVSAQSTRTGDIGLVKGDIRLMKDGLCKMEYIDSNAEIIEGDEIVTSHLSNIFPPGLVIGYVREIKTDIKGLNKTAIIEPSANFKNIETVMIINQIFKKDIKKFESLEDN